MLCKSHTKLLYIDHESEKDDSPGMLEQARFPSTAPWILIMGKTPWLLSD